MNKTNTAILGAACLALLNVQSSAYYSQKDEVELKSIKPNWTVFLVPNKGANKDTQKKFDSSSYMGIEKLAVKSIQIPHEELPKRGLSWNMYIPSATLYVVERLPYARSWTKESTRGTSKADQATYVESSESITIDFGTAIGASISEDDAANFLYTWGTSNVIDQGDSPEYPSVVYARKLEEIMDSYVFQDANAMLAIEFGKNTLDYDIAHKADIMQTVSKQLIEKYKKTGITIQFFGYASGLNFDNEIQKAINAKFIAKKNAEAAEDQAKTIPVLNGLADIEIKQGLAKAVQKFDGKLNLPSFMVIPDGFLNSLGGVLKPNSPEIPKNLK